MRDLRLNLLRQHVAVLLVLAFESLVAVACTADDGVNVRLRKRVAALDQFVCEFDWTSRRCAAELDPAVEANWFKTENCHTLKCQLVLRRPDYRLVYNGPYAGQREVIRAWVGGVRTARQLEDDGKYALVRDRNRWATTGPVPLITAFDEWQTLDIRSSWIDLILEEKLKQVGPKDAGLVFETGALFPEPENWTLRVNLIDAEDVPAQSIQASLPVQNGTITWRYVVREWTRINNVRVANDAVFAMLNTAVDRSRWQVYHFKNTMIRPLSVRDGEGLTPEVPATNVQILDEVGLFARSIDASGQVISEKRWTQDERAEEMREIHDASRIRTQAEAHSITRRNALWMCIAVAVGASSLIGWRVAWARNRT